MLQNILAKNAVLHQRCLLVIWKTFIWPSLAVTIVSFSKDNSSRTEVLEENTENAFIPRKLDESNN
jgi:hypothetical protein